MNSYSGKLSLFLILIFLYAITTNLLLWPVGTDDIRNTSVVDSNDIGTVEFRMVRQEIHMDIHLKAPMTCQEVLTRLSINNMSIDNKTYTPVCEIINNTARIVYKSTIST